jgi:DNA-binding NarL/FixJ family response regulator
MLRTANEAQPPSAVAIVADRRLSVAALVALLSSDSTYQVVGGAEGVADVGRVLQTFQPAVLVLDSPRCTWQLSTDPAAWGGRILLLLDLEDDPRVFVDALRAHAHGYLSRSASREALQAAVATLRKSGSYLDPALTNRMLRALRQTSPTLTASRAGLSRRERDILVRIASGRSTKEVAREYAIAPKTVGNHINNIYQKLNLRHRGDLVLYAAEAGLTSFEPALAGNLGTPS